MSYNALLFACIAGVLTFAFEGEMNTAIITNTLLGFIAGKLTDKNK
jgi:hypothetical protein